MPRLATLSLSASEHEALLTRMKKDPDWRVRARAHTLLLIARGNNFQQVAAIQNLCRQTVSCTYQRWLESGLEGLADRARSGAPAKLSQQEVERILQWAREEPLTVSALKARHEEAGGAVVHPNTLRAALKAGGLVWKRTRHSLKKKRENGAFEQAKQEIADLRARAEAGEIELAYLDESGFAQTHPDRSAWTPVGERHCIDASVRGKRLNVMAAMLSDGTVFSAKVWTTFTAPLFAGFVGLLKKRVEKPLTLILDNASIHKSRAIEPIMKWLHGQGVTLYFLPPYSPELNRIEKLWHLVKYTWMSPRHRDARTLEDEVGEILDNVGSRYKMAF